MPDFATGKIVKDISKSKFDTDKLKTVLSSKIDLNQLIESFPRFYESTLPVYTPFFIIAKLEATFHVFLYLSSNGLYIINEVTIISLSTILFEVKDEVVSRAILDINIIKKLTMSQVSNNEDKANLKEWIRPVWFPPKNESDSNNA
ncbi:uncharacterized protein BX663DRAFT_433035 [Cokeromyces recurvatus]|uniref:uncharacterized protein n=1 Tax=Cokeromyces recurvatus TaxID=90255 RepID=UPI00221F2F5F|nr:uncharacterized protein BX663DRAFT_433035 [Cokeromyces recurvatus]KAI7903639.1 hypothetical protein BX663DRAFT_433035 [Cokeromyces recurvatus]